MLSIRKTMKSLVSLKFAQKKARYQRIKLKKFQADKASFLVKTLFFFH